MQCDEIHVEVFDPVEFQKKRYIRPTLQVYCSIAGTRGFRGSSGGPGPAVGAPNAQGSEVRRRSPKPFKTWTRSKLESAIQFAKSFSRVTSFFSFFSQGGCIACGMLATGGSTGSLFLGWRKENMRMIDCGLVWSRTHRETNGVYGSLKKKENKWFDWIFNFILLRIMFIILRII